MGHEKYVFDKKDEYKNSAITATPLSLEDIKIRKP